MTLCDFTEWQISRPISDYHTSLVFPRTLDYVQRGERSSLWIHLEHNYAMIVLTEDIF